MSKDAKDFLSPPDNKDGQDPNKTRKMTQAILQDQEKEKEIYAAQARDSGKPEKIIDKIVIGKMDKFYEENCLLEQKFIKDSDCTIQELIKQKIATLGENILVSNFCRFEIGN